MDVLFATELLYSVLIVRFVLEDNFRTERLP
jgi:hypothetical protein